MVNDFKLLLKGLNWCMIITGTLSSSLFKKLNPYIMETISAHVFQHNDTQILIYISKDSGVVMEILQKIVVNPNDYTYIGVKQITK